MAATTQGLPSPVSPPKAWSGMLSHPAPRRDDRLAPLCRFDRLARFDRTVDRAPSLAPRQVPAAGKTNGAPTTAHDVWLNVLK